MRHPGKSKMIKRLLTGITIISLLAVFLIGCATVPLTGRTQLSLVGDQQISQLSLTQYREILQKSKLSKNKAQVAMVRRVGTRIARACEDFLRMNNMASEIKNYKWEFNLIDDPKTVNAFCMPGGKIAVYTGILPICKDETGLAVVMGHEVAHALAKHGNERMSQALLVQLGGVALAVALSQKPAATQQAFLAAYGLGATVGVMLPYSRSHEYEADRIGLTLMAMAGYDPHAAVGLWQRMDALSKGKSKAPEFLSTHPVPESRIEYIKKYIPEAMKYYRAETPLPVYARMAWGY